MKLHPNPLTLRPRAWVRRAPLLALPLLLAALGCALKEEEIPPEVPRLIRITMESTTLPAEARREPERAEAWKEVGAFYRRHGYQPVWIGPKGPLPQAEELLAAIGPAGREGLDPRRYGREDLAARLAEAGKDRSLDSPEAQRRLADLDVTLTYTFMALAQHLAIGRERPKDVDVEWYREPRKIDLDKLLARTLESPGNLDQALLDLVPPQPEYDRLRGALARYRGIALAGGWPAVPAGPALKRGAGGPRVAALRKRLAVEGDLAAAAVPAGGPAGGPAGSVGGDAPAEAQARFDDALAQAVARFQRRHGLDPTGEVDEGTIEALNLPAEYRMRQIQVNMERWRWMPRSLGDRYIRVNVPDFRLEVVEGGRTVLEQRVVVGKEQSRTPSFSGRMTYLVLNPTWNIPDGIAREEVVPAAMRNPGYLAAKGIEVVRGYGEDAEVLGPGAIAAIGQKGSDVRLRARAGDDNPLGKVKFMFPNRYDIYLHDTPADHLFAKEERDFSHGCIRLEKPMELAAYLLRNDPKWSPETFQAELAAGGTKSVTLPDPIPVHLLYWTAWVDADGTVELRKDVYGHDATFDDALRAEPPIALDLDAVRGEVKASR